MGSTVFLMSVCFLEKIFSLFRNSSLQYLRYLSYYYALAKRRATTKSRFDIFDPKLTSNPRESGILPQDIEWTLEKPSQTECEKVFLYGVSPSGGALTVTFSWKPDVGGEGSGLLSAQLVYKDSAFVYTFDAADRVECPGDEYKVNGLNLQVISPSRKLRLTFRGLLSRKDSSNNTCEDVFVKLRILWYPLSQVVDSTTDYQDEFVARQLSHEGNGGARERHLSDTFEDRLEQFGQMKGTFQSEADPVEELFLWGSRSKTFVPREGPQKASLRLYIYADAGIGFSLTSVGETSSSGSYLYGNYYPGIPTPHPLAGSQLTNEDLLAVESCDAKAKKFNVTFEGPRNVDMEIVSLSKLSDALVMAKMVVKGKGAWGLLTREAESALEVPLMRDPLPSVTSGDSLSKDGDLVYCIPDDQALDTNLSGGKGSSLSLLSKLSARIKAGNNSISFVIPRGVIVNSHAYGNLLETCEGLKLRIETLQRLAWSKERKGLPEECQKVTDFISENPLPEEIKDQIKRKLRLVYGNESSEMNSKLFAVRSSASGEDSEEMSAAGQMTTILAVKGLESIYQAVMKCWASQFGHVAVEYKRGYGQCINAPMAVVIQEMVDCDSAGVMFTCDPLTGDERTIVITANYGLGESVVSGMSEPDTIKVSVDVRNGKVGQIASIELGSKTKSVKISRMSSEGGIDETKVDPMESERCCLSKEDALDLARIGLMLHSYCKSPRDIEWGVKDGQLYLLQSRPVTNLDRFTEWELMHEMDTGQASTKEYFSRANVGEVMPGAMSHMMHTFTIAGWNVPGFYRTKPLIGAQDKHFCPYFVNFFGVAYNTIFFNLRNRAFRVGDKKNKVGRAMMISLFGHDIEDEQLISDCADALDDPVFQTKMMQFRKFKHLLNEVLFCGNDLMRTKKRYKGFKIFEEGQKFETSKELFTYIYDRVHLSYPGMMVHGACTTTSSMCNLGLILSLTKSGVTSDTFADIAKLLSSCTQVESAEVPTLLREVAVSIKEPEKFRQLSDAEALEWLKTSDTVAGKKFNRILVEHGHRGYKEFDLLVKQWGQNPMPLVQSLKSMLIGDPSAFREKPHQSVDEILDSLTTKVSGMSRFLLKYLILPWSRKSVGLREQSKSFIIFLVDIYRDAFWRLAEIMAHKEGRLPEPDLLFYLKFEEIERLVHERDPLLVAKARQRKRAFAVMNKFKFNEITKGPNIQPRVEKMVNRSLDGSVRLTGTAVCAGKAEGRAFVALSLEEAAQIQPGDILITYSTDIGWSPYFPILAGLATEIGGLVSHGAVIAREYGLPCLVGIEGGCSLFKTGDNVLLDTVKGEIIKIS